MKKTQCMKFFFLLTCSLISVCTPRVFCESEAEIVCNVGHTDEINIVSFSPDGSYLASASNDNTIKIWEVESGIILKTLKGHGSYIKSISYSSDGKHLASASWDDTVKIWDFATGSCIKTMRHKQDANAVAYSPNGAYIASASDDKTIKLWDAKTGECIRTFIGHEKDVTSVSFSPDGFYIASGSLDHTIKVWNVATGECIISFAGEIEDVKSVVYSPDGKYIIGTGWTNVIKMWEVETGRLLRRLDDHKLEVTSVSFSPNGKYMVSSSVDRTLKLFEVESGKCIKTFARGEEYVTSIAYSPDGKTLVSSSSDRRIKFWDVDSGRFIKTVRDDTNWVKSIVYSPDGKSLAIGSADQTIKIWDRNTGSLLQTLEGHTNWVKPIVYSPDGSYLASAGYRTIRCWNVQTGKYAKVMIGHTQNVNKVVFSPNGTYLASTSSDKTVKLWDIESGECVKTFTEKVLGNLLCFSPDGSCLASDGEGDSIKILDVTGDELLMTLQGHKGEITSITYSSDGLYLASTSSDKTIKIWNVQTAECIKTIGDYSGVVESAVYSPDGSYLAVTAWDEASVKIWDVKSGKCMHTLKGHKDWITAVAYAPDGSVLATSSSDSTIKFWDAKTGSLLATTFNLKDYEWLTYTPEGFFAGSKRAREELTYIVDGHFNISTETAFDVFYRPDLVTSKLCGKDISSYAKHVSLQSLAKTGVPPEVSITEVGNKDEKGNVRVEYSIKNCGGGIGEVIFCCNGKNILLAKKIESKVGEVVKNAFTLALQKGKNTFELYAKNEKGTFESAKANDALMWRGKKDKPRLYVMAVGINNYDEEKLHLKLAVPATRLLANIFSKQKKLLYKDIYTLTLLDKDVTKEGVSEAFKKLKDEVQSDDIFILYMAGQAIVHTDGDFYFLPCDFSYRNDESIKQNAISKQDITYFLSLIKTGKTLLLLDAFDARDVLTVANQDEDVNAPLHTQLKEKTAIERFCHATGRATIATLLKGMAGNEEYKSGYDIFAYLLVQGLKGKSDIDADGIITMKELELYVTEEMPRRSANKWKSIQNSINDLKEQNFLLYAPSNK